MVHLTYQNSRTGELFTANWQADDGALSSYTGPGGADWVLIGTTTTQEQVLDYSDSGTFAAQWGAPLAAAGVASGQLVQTVPHVAGSGVPVELTSQPPMLKSIFTTATTPAPAVGGLHIGWKGVALGVLILWLLRR
jgi:hypothetical protein